MLAKTLIRLEKILLQEYNQIIKNKNAQTSVEIILLIGAILTISLITGSYILRISNQINLGFSEVIEKGRDSLINKL